MTRWLLRTDHPFQELLDGTLGLQTAMTMKIQNGSMYFQWYDCVHVKKREQTETSALSQHNFAVENLCWVSFYWSMCYIPFIKGPENV